jgi:hypothetical protein
MTEAKKWLEFERLQANRKGPDGTPLRPPLPCDMGAPKPSRTDTGAFTPILRALAKHGPMTSRDLARLLKKNSHNICGTIRHAVAAGLVDQTPHSILREEDNKENGHMDCWLYHIAA